LKLPYRFNNGALEEKLKAGGSIVKNLEDIVNCVRGFMKGQLPPPK